MKTRWVCGAVAFKKYERDTKVTWIYHTMNSDTSKVSEADVKFRTYVWKHVLTPCFDLLRTCRENDMGIAPWKCMLVLWIYQTYMSTSSRVHATLVGSNKSNQIHAATFGASCQFYTSFMAPWHPVKAGHSVRKSRDQKFFWPVYSVVGVRLGCFDFSEDKSHNLYAFFLNQLLPTMKTGPPGDVLVTFWVMFWLCV